MDGLVCISTDQRNKRRSPPLRIVHKIVIVVVPKAVSTTDQRSCVVAVDVSMGLLKSMTSSISKHVNTTARRKGRAASQRRQQGAPGVDPPKEENEEEKKKKKRENTRRGRTKPQMVFLTTIGLGGVAIVTGSNVRTAYCSRFEHHLATAFGATAAAAAYKV